MPAPIPLAVASGKGKAQPALLAAVGEKPGIYASTLTAQLKKGKSDAGRTSRIRTVGRSGTLVCGTQTGTARRRAGQRTRRTRGAGRAAPTATPTPRSHCLLIVEDNEAVAESLADLLTAAVHQVTRAADVGEVTRILASQAPLDMVLTDVLLPSGSGGADVVRKARQLAATLAAAAAVASKQKPR